ncbi:MAG: bifunctional diguanylate cyclase/phosphodiesterase [Hydrogenophilaceae bacterium]|nr:bifunctional diguanylate cyclase/phosphodiesterase [Hydrogenophilaceae bacterium]
MLTSYLEPSPSQFDSLTGLLDREGCARAAETMLAKTAQEHLRPLAVFWLNIDRFKQINDSLGHLAGDGVLAELAHRLAIASGNQGYLARMGGDEFVLLVSDCNRAAAEHIARDLLAAMSQPLDVGTMRLYPSVSIGIALSNDRENARELLERADQTLVHAKRLGGAQYLFAGEDVQLGRLGKLLAREELEVEEALHKALESGGLSLHYQPILQVADGSLEAVEALMRCNCEGTMYPPDRFIPVAEKTGLIIRLGEWSLLTGARYVSKLLADKQRIKVAINVSRAQLTAPKFTQALYAALACSNAPAELIELEITESLFMDSSDIVQRNIRAVLEAGFPLAIDDFGTGYSCLASLKDLPARKLKLDRAFITDLPHNPRSFAIAKAIVHLALDLGMSVVAEGVETIEQHAILSEMGATAIQGFYLARPMPERQLDEWLAMRRSR